MVFGVGGLGIVNFGDADEELARQPADRFSVPRAPVHILAAETICDDAA
ncbi:hypothetical protein OAG86_04275 [Akkermansiaceae bacterium]|nr:hypothetical protein [Akkermansiaceae bacterium]